MSPAKKQLRFRYPPQRFPHDYWGIMPNNAFVANSRKATNSSLGCFHNETIGGATRHGPRQ